MVLTVPNSEPVASSSRLQPPPSPQRPLLPLMPTSTPTPYVPPTHPGCVLCGLVASAASQSRTRSSFSHSDDGSTSSTPRAGSPARSPVRSQPMIPSTSASASASGSAMGLGLGQTVKVGDREIVYRDQDITVFPAIGKERLCSDGRHLIIVMNQHVESVYNLGPSDIPLLSHMLDTARQFLSSLPSTSASGDSESAKLPDLRVGFVGPIMRDPRCPYPHLHAHAMLGPVDTSLPGAGLWRRNVVFGSLNWWSIEDLRAEIRESTSNNRVKSGYEDRRTPLDKVPDAGSLSGPANALDPDLYSDSSRPITPVPAAMISPGLGPTSVPLSERDLSNSTPTPTTSADRGKARALEEDYEAVDLGVRQ